MTTTNLDRLLEAVEDAADGDSNDKHIVALQAALNAALDELEKTKVVVKRSVIEQVLAFSTENYSTLSDHAAHAALEVLAGNWKDAASDGEFTVDSMLGDLEETTRALAEFGNVVRQVSEGVVIA